MTLRDEEKQLRASALENARLREENERLRAERDVWKRRALEYAERLAIDAIERPACGTCKGAGFMWAMHDSRGKIPCPDCANEQLVTPDPNTPVTDPFQHQDS